MFTPGQSRFPWFLLPWAHWCQEMQGCNRTSLWLLQLIAKFCDTKPWNWKQNVHFSHLQVPFSWLPHNAREEDTACLERRRVASVKMQFAIQQKREEGAAEGNMGAMKEAPENTNIWSSERYPKARMLGKTHTEEEHEENLITFIKKWVKREKIAGNQRALIKLNSLRFYMMQWDTQWKIPMSHLVFVMGCKQSEWALQLCTYCFQKFRYS